MLSRRPSVPCNRGRQTSLSRSTPTPPTSSSYSDTPDQPLTPNKARERNLNPCCFVSIIVESVCPRRVAVYSAPLPCLRRSLPIDHLKRAEIPPQYCLVMDNLIWRHRCWWRQRRIHKKSITRQYNITAITSAEDAGRSGESAPVSVIFCSVEV